MKNMIVNRLLICLVASTPFIGSTPARAQALKTFAVSSDSFSINVNNSSIDGAMEIRGVRSAFPDSVLTLISLTDSSGYPVTGLADTARWVGPHERAENGQRISDIWRPIFEYHKHNPNFPDNPDLYASSGFPRFTEVRNTTIFQTSTMLVMDMSERLRRACRHR